MAQLPHRYFQTGTSTMNPEQLRRMSQQANTPQEVQRLLAQAQRMEATQRQLQTKAQERQAQVIRHLELSLLCGYYTMITYTEQDPEDGSDLPQESWLEEQANHALEQVRRNLPALAKSIGFVVQTKPAEGKGSSSESSEKTNPFPTQEVGFPPEKPNEPAKEGKVNLVDEGTRK